MRNILGVLVTIAILACLAGCDTVTGGGWIISAGDPAKKATFGLTMSCTDVPGGVIWQGTIEYHDQFKTWPDSKGKLRPLALNASVNWNDINFGGQPFPGTCAGYDTLGAEAGFVLFGWTSGTTYTAPYIPQPQTLGPGGTLWINVQDIGKKGPDKGDVLSIVVTDGLYAGYTNTGVLQGGNITVSLP